MVCLYLLRLRRVRNILMCLNYVTTANEISPASRMLKSHLSLLLAPLDTFLGPGERLTAQRNQDRRTVKSFR